jgi:hypothetical protein
LGVPDALFQSERWDAAADPALAWAFPVAPDTAVEVRLYLAEIFDTVTAAGQRVFNVNVEGVQVLRHFDAFAEFGGFVGGMHVSRMVVGPDGVLDVNLERVLQNPTIKGIEIVSMNDCADDDVTLIDYAAFHDCFTGVAGDPDPERTPHGDCTFCFDDGDGDIDLADFAVFQAAFGPG